MTHAGKPEGDEASNGSLAGALAGFLDHFFSTIGKHQPGCAIETPAAPDEGQLSDPNNASSNEKTGTAE